MTPRTIIVTWAAHELAEAVRENGLGEALDDYLAAVDEAGAGSLEERRAFAELVHQSAHLNRLAARLRRECADRRYGEVALAVHALGIALRRERTGLALLAEAGFRRPVFAALRRRLWTAWGARLDEDLRDAALRYGETVLELREASLRLGAQLAA